jgi:hypothetical protein
MSSNGSQIVYVLTNPAMPGLVKIGMTTQAEVDERMKQLYGTGVPVPFECVFACQVKDAAEVEKAFHFGFGGHRINPNREFFRIEPERVVALLKLLKIEDITLKFEQQLDAEASPVDRQSGEALKRRMRPRMNFYELGIPVGSVLIFKDGTNQATVVDDKTVGFNDEHISLTMATRKVLKLPLDTPLQPSPYWTFNGKTVKEIYEDFHSTGVEN